MLKKLFNTLEDFLSLTTHIKIWLHLGWMDIRQRYMGSVLGPLWITLNLSIFLVALGIVYSRLFHQSLQEYIPFLTCGLLAWTFISSVMIDSCDMFIMAKPYLYQIKLPFTLFVYQTLWRNILIFLHNLVVYLMVIFIFKIKITKYALLFFPGFLIVVSNLIFISLFIGIISTRYRDMPPLITSLIQVLFFISPITWMPHLVKNASKIIIFNPVTYLIDLIRAPLLGSAPQTNSWYFGLSFFLIGFILVSLIFNTQRHKVPFWL